MSHVPQKNVVSVTKLKKRRMSRKRINQDTLQKEDDNATSMREVRKLSDSIKVIRIIMEKSRKMVGEGSTGHDRMEKRREGSRNLQGNLIGSGATTETEI